MPDRRRRAAFVLPAKYAFERHRSRLEERLSYRFVDEFRPLGEPALAHRHAPELRAARIGRRPSQQWRLHVNRPIVRGEQLDAVLVRIAEVGEQRVTDSVIAGTAVDAVAKAGRARRFARVMRVCTSSTE